MIDHLEHKIGHFNGRGKGMSGNGDHGLGTLPSQPWASPESSMEALPSRGGRSLTPKIAPKGHIFTNLEEAHQAIASRLAAPRSASNNSQQSPPTPSFGSVDSIPSSLDVLASSGRPSDKVPTVKHMELARTDHRVNGRSLTAPQTPFSTTRDGDPYPGATRPPAGGTLPALPVGRVCETDTSSDRRFADTLADRALRETGSTVENVYSQYPPSETPSADDHKAGSDSETHLESPAASSQDDEENDANYRLESSENATSPNVQKAAGDLDSGKNRLQLYFSPTNAPHVPLPELPLVRDTLQQSSVNTSLSQGDISSTGQSVTSISDSQILLNEVEQVVKDGEALPQAPDNSHLDDSDMFYLEGERAQGHMATENIATYGHPSTNPFHSIHHLAPGDNLNRASFGSHYGISNCGFSSGGITSESDNDPFRYDRGSYGVFIKPSREREVSVALHRVSSTVGTPHNKARFRTSLPSPGSQSIPPVPPLPPQSTVNMPNGAMQSNNPFFNQMNLKLHQKSAVTRTKQGAKESKEVKISVQSKQNPPPQAPQVNEPASLATRLDGLKDEKFGLSLGKVISDGGDWETIGTDVGHFDSNRAYASGSLFGGSGQIKETGSSIADYSDDGFTCPSFGNETFCSGDRILEHPMPGNGPHSRHLRATKDTGRPIFLAKPRFHQVNGYLRNSLHTFTDQISGSSGSSATRYLADKISGPFRSDSQKRRQQNRQNPYKHIERSKFEFRDSCGSVGLFNLATLKAGQPSVWKDEAIPKVGPLKAEPAKNDEDSKQSRYAKTNEECGLTPVQGDSFFAGHVSSVAQTEESFGPSSPVQFSFPLIPLHEAVKLEAIRRESGEDVVSLRSSMRTRINSSLVSSRATQRTTPPTVPAQVAKPQPAHQRRPTTPFRLVPETTLSTLQSTSDQTITPDDHNSGSLQAPGRVVFPRSCRNPFTSVHGSVRSSSTFQGPASRYEPHLWPRDRRNPFHRPGTSEDPDLRGIVDLNRGASIFGFASEDASLSWEARRRREVYYYLVCGLCVLPFFAVLVYRDKANAALSWYTKGETCTLSYKQRRNVIRVARISGVFWLCAMVVLISVVATTQAVKNRKAY